MSDGCIYGGTLGKIIPGTLPLEEERRTTTTTFRVFRSLSSSRFLFLLLKRQASYKKASPSPLGSPLEEAGGGGQGDARNARRMTSKRHVCGKRRAWRSWSLRIETLRAATSYRAICVAPSPLLLFLLPSGTLLSRTGLHPSRSRRKAT